jgi:hypothetical protein
VKGVGNEIDYGMRVYDPRVGRFLSLDPLQKKYPWYTPYQFAGNKPILFVDIDGLEESPSLWQQLQHYKMQLFASIFVAASGHPKEGLALATSAHNPLQGILAPAGQKVMTSVGSTLNGGLHTLTFNAWPIDPSGTLGGTPTLNEGASFVGQVGMSLAPTPFHGTPGASLELASGSAPLSLPSLDFSLRLPSIVYSNTPSADDNSPNEATASARKSTQLATNSQSGMASEDIVRGKLQGQLGENEAILAKPRIYIGDGSSGKYATPDFAIDNTKNGQISRIVDAKNGGATLSTAQQQLNQYGGVFRGSSRATDATPQSIKPDMIEVERTNVNK